MGRLTDRFLPLFFPAAAGFVLGAFYFGVMWLTVERLERSAQPGLLLLVSMFGRLAITLTLFYRVADGRADRLLACLAGFIVARVVLVSRIRPRAGRHARDGTGGGEGRAPDA